MPRTINNLIQSSSKIQILDIIVQAMENTEKQAISAQQQQLISGLRSDDENIFNIQTGSDEYSPAYAKKKGKLKPIDLYDTGAFSGGVFAQPSRDGILLDSSDQKSQLLQKNYGTEIFGFGTGAKTDYLDAVGPEFVRLISESLNEKVSV
jgi:hypothetical protein